MGRYEWPQECELDNGTLLRVGFKRVQNASEKAEGLLGIIGICLGHLNEVGMCLSQTNSPP